MESLWPDSARLAVLLLIELPGAPLTSAAADYGLDCGLPRLLHLLSEHSFKASLLVDSDLAETRPELLAELVGAGHELVAHSPASDAAELLEQLQALPTVVVQGWRCSDEGEPAESAELLACGYRYELVEARSELPLVELSEVGPLLMVPVAADLSDLPLQGNCATDAWLQYLVDSFDTLFEEALEEPKLLTLHLHPEIIGRPGRIKALEQFLQYLLQHEHVWVAPAGAIALVGS